MVPRPCPWPRRRRGSGGGGAWSPLYAGLDPSQAILFQLSFAALSHAASMRPALMSFLRPAYPADLTRGAAIARARATDHAAHAPMSEKQAPDQNAFCCGVSDRRPRVRPTSRNLPSCCCLGGYCSAIGDVG